jgi:ribokinase
MNLNMKKILIIGSSNVDLVATMDDFPKIGETVEGNSFGFSMGGKGANQAVAAKRAGGIVTFITSVGDDDYGHNALEFYKKEGVDISYSIVNENVTTGTASIWVDKNGDNSIVIIPGANDLLSPEIINKNMSIIEESDIIVLQMEIPYQTVKAICKIAYQKGKIVILNAAPAYPLDEDILKAVVYLIVNENEAETILHENKEEIGVEGLVDKLIEKCVKNVILTLGRDGCIYKDSKDHFHIPAFSVETKDSTGAGDTFCGALATRISKGECMKDALIFASAAAALCVTKMGALPSVPTEAEINLFLSNNIN